MNRETDPFAHHPELRDGIEDPMHSSLRDFTTADLAAKTKEMGLTQNWWHADEVREAMRRDTLASYRDKDLWVFGYGSLMWDPGFRFAEVRRAHVHDYARRFILKDIYGGRGTIDAPGIMVALDSGDGCDGLLFLVRKENIEVETEVLWRREMIGPAYKPVFIEAVMEEGPISALTFIADHDAVLIDASITRKDQIHYLATGKGFMGTSLEYLQNIEIKLRQLGIEDVEVTALLQETVAYLGTLG